MNLKHFIIEPAYRSFSYGKNSGKGVFGIHYFSEFI